MYDFLIVGSGLFGAVIAHELTAIGKSCIVLEKRSHVGGNIYTELINDIVVHKYGAHIFHTNSREIWNYMGQFADFNRYTNSPLANYKGVLYNLPFNMNTFYQMWGIKTPQEAFNKIESQKLAAGISIPRNLEEQAISLVGIDIYEKLIKGYTEKQWGKCAKELPTFIIQRLPVRFTFDNNYFNDNYQGIPIGGYTPIIEKMLCKSEVLLNVDYLSDKNYFNQLAKNIIYTGTIDRYFDYCYGPLEYRSLKFETIELLDQDNFQGNAVVNYTDIEIPYTRIIEHKHFEFGKQSTTIITKEYPQNFQSGCEPYYPINDKKNNSLYEKYLALSKTENHIYFGGRLASYKYFDMDKTIERALYLISQIT